MTCRQWIRRHWQTLLLLTPAAIMLLLFLAYPMFLMLRMSFCEGGGQSGFGIGGGTYRPGTWTIANYQQLAGERYFREVFGFTLALAVTVTALAMMAAWPLALFIWSLRGPWKSLAQVAVIAPKLANVLVLIYGLELLLGAIGPVNQTLLAMGAIAVPLELLHNLTGVLIGELYLIVPYTTLTLVAALDRIDPNLVAAARGLGAGHWQTFSRVLFPLTLPGQLLSATISLIWAVGAFVGPALLGGPQQTTLAMDVQKQMFENLHWPRSAATAVILTATVVVLLVGCSQIVRTKTRAVRSIV